MSKKGGSPAKGRRVSVASFMYYTAVSLAALAAITAYSAGASLEAALLRAVIVLLVSTILGYAMNIALWLSNMEQKADLTPDCAGNESITGGVLPAEAGSSSEPAQAGVLSDGMARMGEAVPSGAK